jgi:hypothetical protein
VTTQGQPAPARTSGPDLAGLVDALIGFREAVAGMRFPLALPDAAESERLAKATVGQIDDYLIPRLGRLDAPLLVVVGGSTGAGKSTLVNSLVRVPASPAGVLRPTTRSPVLVCHTDDTGWFTEAHLLPGLARTKDRVSDGGALQIVAVPTLHPGLALLDAPDIDSVVESNRALAEQLLAAADLWLFVTTAARYADAVPWGVLHDARDRGAAVAMVLDRVPAGAEDTVSVHLTQMLAEHDLGGVRVYVVPETRLDGQGLLPERAVGPLRDWLASLATSVAARAAVVRQTVDGAIRALGPVAGRLGAAAGAQVAATEALAGAVRQACEQAEAEIERGVRDGTLLRGEVLARWQEFVGTGELMRGLQARVALLRDRIVGVVTGRPRAANRVQAALESGLVTLVRGAAADAAERAAAAWRAHPAGAALLDRADPAGPVNLGSAAADLPERAERMVRDWQRSVLDLVRAEVGDKAFMARVSAYAVNALGLVVMVAVFTATAFIPTGAELAVAGGTTLAAQKVLEAIFGDQAVRELADRARVDLLDRVRALLADEGGRFLLVLTGAGVDVAAPERLNRAAVAVASARAGSVLAVDGDVR